MTKTPILQFGTSRFLQAHADLFVSEAMAAGQAVGPITVVQSSGHAGRSARLAALAAPFPVRVRGLRDGKPVQEEVRVGSVARTLSTSTDWDAVTRVFVDEAEVVLSNTGDTGYAPSPDDDAARFSQTMSFPAKLTVLLLARFQAGARPIQVMPLELITRNGDVLKARVSEIAASQPAAFRAWLETGVVWVNSLVDRIVSEPIEPAGAVAETYALWAIEDQPGLKSPCDHPAVQIVPNLAPVAALKLFILNLGHTFMADRWLRDRGADADTVRAFVADADRRGALEALYRAEVLPGFAAAGMEAEAAAYIATTLDRFANPFLDHRIGDIAQNHPEKVARRLAAFRDWARASGDATDKPVLQDIIDRTEGAAP